MLNNNNNQSPNNIKLNINKVDLSVYLPKLLHARLARREKLKYFSIVFFIYNLILIVLGIFYLDAGNTTREYISNGDEFWDFIQQNKVRPKELALFYSFTGLFSILSSCFNIMNGLVILKHIFRGGLKIRLSFATYTTLILQIINFSFSLYVLLKYKSVIFLDIFLIIFNSLHFFITVFYFYLTRKVIVKEDSYMLPFSTLNKHKLDYFEEYERKLNLNRNQEEVINNDDCAKSINDKKDDNDNENNNNT